jgi:ferritin-like metal-binding protein YciE
MASAEEHLMDWLRDAHAAEQHAETMLSGMANRIQNYPQLKARIEQHVRETQRHAELVAGCLERRKGSTSALKDVGAKMIGLGQALSGMFVTDEVMKGCIAGYAFEAMEIASYRILVDAARQVGDEQTASVCEQILREEQDMAKWLQDNIPGLTRQYLARDQQPGATSKH